MKRATVGDREDGKAADVRQSERDGFVPISMGSPIFRSAAINGFLVTHAAFPAGAVLPSHAHERAVFSIVLEGSFDLLMGGRTRGCGAATVFTEPGGDRHANHFGSAGAEVLVLQPDPALELPLECVRMLDGRIHFPHAPIATLARRLQAEIDQPDDLSRLSMEAFALEMLALAGRRDRSDRQSAQPPAWLALIHQVIHDRFREPLRMEELSTEAGVHTSHLTRVFREWYGASPGAYIRGLRLDWAARRLLDSDDSLAAVAIAAGFADQSHFTRAFRRRTGLPPGRFRQVSGHR